MEVDAKIVTINGVEYVTRQECERLLSEADNRRRLQMQEENDELRRDLRAAHAEMEAIHDYTPGEM